ncbi:MAG: S41 family peptidase [Anaerolineae bacterium]|nr:S41 family peptidase [Anaerolineae bacterium]
MSDSRRGLQLVGCLVLGLCLAVIYAAGFGAYHLWERQYNPQRAVNDSQKQMGAFWEAWRVLEQGYYGELPTEQERTYGAIREALVLLGDPYTIFVEPQPRELERDHMRGSFGGIGVDIWYDAKGQMVLSPYPDSPAAKAGILAGDVLLALDGEQLATETIDDVRAYLHGEQGTTVALTLMRPGPDGSPTPSFDLTITRGEIRVPSVTWRVIAHAPTVGYIHIQGFTDRTDEEVVGALNDLKGQGITSLILDLRDNFGGLISPAVGVASQFLSDGVVMIEQKRTAEESVYPVQAGGIATDIPMVVLVNGNTASAAEIVAGALQDHGRAPLIGERTYGKGSVQLIYDLSDGSSLHVTSAIWLTPNRTRIEGRGLMPDVLAPQADGPRDAQLDYAVEYLLK